MHWIDIGMAFSMGLIGGIHCVGMCGGILVAVAMGQRRFWWPGLFFYHIGRITTYSVLGLLGGFLTQYITVTSRFQMYFSVITGILIIIFALQIGGWISGRFIPAFSISIPTSLLRRVNESGSVATWGLTGLLNGLLPCGMVYAAVALAINRETPLYSFMTMLIFGLGTVPALTVFFGLIRPLAPSIRGALLKWGAMVLVLFGLFTMLRGFGFMPASMI